ncbi:hypothetical protein [Calycomorphotria hydatis]|uniref:Carboxypeptidase regulatory-like domain-containing protein n=1 Tax=Calycomorphotria hydatis TaxID=2528027 RepID=A0A517T954_9PLAN|nr:hypothetical protein [Calycomorphotria hydatis]QDT64893.1 hypothetical protein V22_21360 [Calycomorphotria hydatis]
MSRLSCLVLFWVAVLGGCSDGPPKYTITGAVTFEGSPIDDGTIIFRHMEGNGQTYSTRIEDGKYSVEAIAGPMRVEVRATREIPGEFDEPAPGVKVPKKEMHIPLIYNANSELTVDVTKDQGGVDFAL